MLSKVINVLEQGNWYQGDYVDPTGERFCLVGACLSAVQPNFYTVTDDAEIELTPDAFEALQTDEFAALLREVALLVGVPEAIAQTADTDDLVEHVATVNDDPNMTLDMLLERLTAAAATATDSATDTTATGTITYPDVIEDLLVTTPDQEPVLV